MKLLSVTIVTFLMFFLFVACEDGPSLQTPIDEPVYDMTGIARGADISWLTEMEKSGSKFYNASGKEMECMHLLRDLGMNSIRLRVWVNPSEGWSKE